jgi:hypothetical protein
MHCTADGFLRMTLEDALCLPFSHLISGVDEFTGDGPTPCGSRTTLSGYTEWITGTNPPVSIGWDWAVDAERWIRVSPPRSNVLLVDLEAVPYDWEKNQAVLGTVVDAIPWQEQALSAVALRYR